MTLTGVEVVTTTTTVATTTAASTITSTDINYDEAKRFIGCTC